MKTFIVLNIPGYSLKDSASKLCESFQRGREYLGIFSKINVLDKLIEYSVL